MSHFHIHVSIILSLIPQIISSSTFTITNNCDHTIWPGLLSGAGTASLPTTGFALRTSESRSFQVPTGWSGRIWARTFCSADSATGKFACATGDCGSSGIQCSGSGAAPPATLAEFTLNGSGGMDFYDVSLVDGYNLPMLVVPQGGSGGNCSTTGCLVDLNGLCPQDLKVMASSSNGRSVACKSACEAFGTPEYCCSGAYGNPNTCKPTSYSELFKNACPRAYSYAYDDGTSTFTCANADYVITFCPAVSSQKSGRDEPDETGLPVINQSMIFLSGGEEVSRKFLRFLPFVSIGTTIVLSWQLMQAKL